jgi:hypothetical protein
MTHANTLILKTVRKAAWHLIAVAGEDSINYY